MTTNLEWSLARCPRSLSRIISDVLSRDVIAEVNGCWIWANESNTGYPHFGIGHNSFPAHKVFYAYFIAPVGEGMVIDHICRNKRCVNPWHLDQVTNAVNVRRGFLARLGKVKGPAWPSDAAYYRAVRDYGATYQQAGDAMGRDRSSAHTFINGRAA